MNLWDPRFFRAISDFLDRIYLNRHLSQRRAIHVLWHICVAIATNHPDEWERARTHTGKSLR